MTEAIRRKIGFAAIAMLTTMLFLLTACQKTPPAVPELPDLTIGIVAATQPMGTTDLLAGFIPDDRVLASSTALAEFNKALMDTLRKETQRVYTFIPYVQGVDPSESRMAGRNGALTHWTRVGKEMKVDLLIVPQIIDWRERVGGEAGVSTSAAVSMDFYLIDVRGDEGVLISRSHFWEKQIGLSDNLMNLDTFLKRGGKWLSTQELALEGVDKMIQEFGL